MNSYYETYLRKNIFRNNQHYADVICDIYDTNPQEKEYIIRVMEWYIRGGSEYSTYSLLLNNVIRKIDRINATHNELDQAYQDALAK